MNATLGGARAVATLTIVDNGDANVAPTFTEGTSTTRSVAENTAIGRRPSARQWRRRTPTATTRWNTPWAGRDFKSFGIHLNTGQLLTQAAARLRDEVLLRGDGLGLGRQWRLGQHQRDHHRHGRG